MSAITKVMKFQLNYENGCGGFPEMQAEVWELQKKTREILNRTIQEMYHWDYLDRKHFEETGEYLNVQQETGYKTYDGCVYNLLKSQYDSMSSSNLNATIRKAFKKYKDARKEMRSGEMSIPSYKRDQPLALHNSCVRLSVDGSNALAEITLFRKKYADEKGFDTLVTYSLSAKDGTQRAILSRLGSGEYKLGESQLIYERPKWFLMLTYSFEPQKTELDPNRILGVDLGEANAVYASVYNEFGSLRIEGGEVTEFAARHEARRRSMQRQAAVCGEGRVGHGTKARVATVYREEDRIAAFRDTVNHRYSRAVVDFAVKNGCGTIQMEDLSGIREDTGYPKLLRHWTYFDLQTKIENKAKEKGIAVVRVKPSYTSQRCSRCGFISAGNRTTQERFLCLQCGFKANADYNASQNLALKNIAEIIKKDLSANPE